MKDGCLAYKKIIEENILTYWATASFDITTNMFAERLDFNGEAILNIPHRAMVQARQIYVFSDAARTGRLPEGGDFALSALDVLIQRFCDEGDASRGFAFSITRDGTVASAKRDAYAHAFILFALAAAHQLTGEQQYLKIAARTNDFIEKYLFDPMHGGVYSSYPHENHDKLQNPLMHLLEAYLALHETEVARFR